MQVDLHYGMSFVLARLAQFERHEAEIIARASQYVDDAVNGGVIEFNNGAKYERISCAHLAKDFIHNIRDIENHRTWVPFHFLPGNCGRGRAEQGSIDFIDKIICCKNSEVAKEVVNSALSKRDESYFLYYVGIALHAYIDTWSHQGFAGVIHEVNEIRNFDRPGFSWGEFVDKVKSYVVDGLLPLGHAGALRYPDTPYLKWSYENARGQHIERDNATEFIEAAQWCYSFLATVKEQRDELGFVEPPADDLRAIKKLFVTLESDDEFERLEGWSRAIERGSFSFGREELPAYTAKGVGSWKHAALDTEAERDANDSVFKYRPDFLHSNWKLFHDAVLDYRFTVVYKILPEYGICV